MNANMIGFERRVTKRMQDASQGWYHVQPWGPRNFVVFDKRNDEIVVVTVYLRGAKNIIRMLNNLEARVAIECKRAEVAVSKHTQCGNQSAEGETR